MANGRVFVPDPRGRSATAVAGKADVVDDNIYSSILVTQNASGSQKLFTVPQGQAIPRLGSATPTAADHQGTHSELTTSMTQAGMLGAAIGDASIRSIGLTLEARAPTSSSTTAAVDATSVTAQTGVPGYSIRGDGNATIGPFGFSAGEMAKILGKCWFQLKIAGKVMTTGPVWLFPGHGGLSGSIGIAGLGTAVASNWATVAVANNGPLGQGRKLRSPILVARTDTLEGVIGVASGAILVLDEETAAAGATTGLVYCNLKADIARDAR